MVVNYFTFGGVNSKDYGIYISSEAVFGTPERSVEAISIPGRNGDLLIDQGRWENIKAEYTAGTFADNAEDFANKISAFRNAIASKIGYQRLEDTYNPDEYRMAAFVSGIDVDTVNYNEAGEFKIIFNCKPQRWLKDGETPITIASGDTVENPTLFDSYPLLAAEGYGEIEFNGYTVNIINKTLGEIELLPRLYRARPFNYSRTFSQRQMNSGDAITLNKLALSISLSHSGYARLQTSIDKIEKLSGDLDANFGHGVYISTPCISAYLRNGNSRLLTLAFINQQRKQYSCSYRVTWDAFLNEEDVSPTTQIVTTFTFTVTVTVEGSFHVNVAWTEDGTNVLELLTYEFGYENLVGDSTMSLLGHPTYVDCDLGEAYMFTGGELVSLNEYIALGSDLPCFAPGENEITLANTITDLKVTPRWWKL